MQTRLKREKSVEAEKTEKLLQHGRFWWIVHILTISSQIKGPAWYREAYECKEFNVWGSETQNPKAGSKYSSVAE